jgi:hypothetical protein
MTFSQAVPTFNFVIVILIFVTVIILTFEGLTKATSVWTSVLSFLMTG